MSPRRADLGWGLVGGLSYLVLLSGYELATGWRAGLLTKFGIAALIAATAAILTAVTRRRLAARNGRA